MRLKMPALTDTAASERSKVTKKSASPADAVPRPRGGQIDKAQWWRVPNFGYLLVWWVAIVGYYVVFDSISGRYHEGGVDLQMILGGWSAILISGIIGAFYAKRSKLLWFAISIVVAVLLLLLMLLLLQLLMLLLDLL